MTDVRHSLGRYLVPPHRTAFSAAVCTIHFAGLVIRQPLVDCLHNLSSARYIGPLIVNQSQVTASNLTPLILSLSLFLGFSVEQEPCLIVADLAGLEGHNGVLLVVLRHVDDQVDARAVACILVQGSGF